jgi:hypothetical protein
MPRVLKLQLPKFNVIESLKLRRFGTPDFIDVATYRQCSTEQRKHDELKMVYNSNVLNCYC